MNTQFADPVLRRWWLRRLDAPTARALEEHLLVDAQLAARVQDAEHDLYDDQVRGRLDADEAAALKRVLADDAIAREHLRLARALAHAATNPGVVTARFRRRRVAVWVGVMAACAALAFVLAGRMPTQAPPPPATVVVAQLTLLADTARGANSEMPGVTVPRAVTLLRVQVEIAQPDVDARYTLAVKNAGKVLATAKNLSLLHSGPYIFVEAELPVADVAGGTRTVEVRRQDGIGPSMVWSARIEMAK